MRRAGRPGGGHGTVDVGLERHRGVCAGPAHRISGGWAKVPLNEGATWSWARLRSLRQRGWVGDGSGHFPSSCDGVSGGGFLKRQFAAARAAGLKLAPNLSHGLVAFETVQIIRVG